METLLPQSPSRLSERRGKPELQLLEPSALERLPDTEIQLSNSSIPSDIFPPDPYETPILSTPATPTDVVPIKALASPFGTMSTIVGTSIMEEEEPTECGCHGCEDCGVYTGAGLGLDVIAMEKNAAYTNLDSTLLSKQSQEQQIRSRFPFDGLTSASHYHYNEKLAPVTMPPTPPSNNSEQTTHSIDPDAFSCGPPSLPQSPQSATSRAATILNKVVPSKLRASLKRRLSSPNHPANAPPPPPLSTMPNMTAMTAMAAMAGPHTPPDEGLEFGSLFAIPPASLPSMEDTVTTLASPEATLPPLLSPLITTYAESYVGSPRHSPLGMSFFSSEVFPEMSHPASPSDLVSPLHPPTRSPLISPSFASESQSSLSVASAPSISTHKKAPSIDPTTPIAPLKMTTPPEVVTADSLADMIEEQRSDLAAYDATLARMIESGWSSPQEISNVERQRQKTAEDWDRRITESKKILEAARRNEVKHSAMSSVSSFDSVGSTMVGSVGLVITPLATGHVTTGPSTTPSSRVASFTSSTTAF